MLDSVLNASNETLYLIILIAALPWFLGAVNASAWSPTTKTLTLAIASVVVAVGYLAAIDQLDTANLVRLALVIGAGATVVYRLFKTPISHWERLTDMIAGRPDAGDLIAIEAHPDVWVKERKLDGRSESNVGHVLQHRHFNGPIEQYKPLPKSSRPFLGSLMRADTIPKEWLPEGRG